MDDVLRTLRGTIGRSLKQSKRQKAKPRHLAAIWTFSSNFSVSVDKRGFLMRQCVVPICSQREFIHLFFLPSGDTF